MLPINVGIEGYGRFAARSRSKRARGSSPFGPPDPCETPKAAGKPDPWLAMEFLMSPLEYLIFNILSACGCMYILVSYMLGVAFLPVLLLCELMFLVYVLPVGLEVFKLFDTKFNLFENSN